MIFFLCFAKSAYLKRLREMNLSNWVKVFSSLIIVTIIILSAMLLSNPLLKSSEKIRSIILEKTPIGAQWKEVAQALETKLKDSFSGAHIQSLDSENKRITVYLGNDYLNDLLFDTDVYAIWDFDESLNLEEVTIKKVADAI